MAMGKPTCSTVIVGGNYQRLQLHPHHPQGFAGSAGHCHQPVDTACDDHHTLNSKTALLIVNRQLLSWLNWWCNWLQLDHPFPSWND